MKTKQSKFMRVETAIQYVLTMAEMHYKEMVACKFSSKENLAKHKLAIDTIEDFAQNNIF